MSIQNFLIFLVHLFSGLFLFVFFTQTGFLLRALFKKINFLEIKIKNQFANISLDALCGIMLINFISIIFFTYTPFIVLKIAVVIITAIMLGSFILKCFLTKSNDSNWKKNLPFYFLLLLSFIVVYLPFVKSDNYFLASEGGGDHTVYMGAMNIYKSADSTDPLNKAWINNYPLNTTIVDFPTLKNLLQDNFVDKDLNKTLQDNLLNIEGARRQVLSVYTPAYWSLPYFVAYIFSPYLPYESSYMILLFTLYCFTLVFGSILISQVFEKKNLINLPTITGFLILAASPVLFGIFINHFYLQAFCVLLNLGLFIYITDTIHNAEWDLDSDLFLFTCVACATISGYFVNIIFFSIIFVVYLFYRLISYSFLKNRLIKVKNKYLYILPVLLIIILLPNFMLQIQLFLSSFGPTIQSLLSAKNTMTSNYMGNAVKTFGPAVYHSLGILYFQFLYPYTQNQFANFFITKVYTFLGYSFPFVLVVCIGLFLTNLKKIKESSLFQFNYLLILNSILFTMVIYITKNSEYTFFKTTSMSFPILLITFMSSLYFIFHSLKSNRWLNILLITFSSAHLFLWLASEAEIRVKQIQTFYNSEDRSQILYTKFINGNDKKNSTTKLFYYPHSNTAYSLFESILAGKNATSIGQLFTPSYLPFLPQSSLKQVDFLLPTENKKQYKMIPGNEFIISRTKKSFAWPMSPYLDLKLTKIPTIVCLDRASFLEIIINSTEKVRFIYFYEPDLNKLNILKNQNYYSIKSATNFTKNELAYAETYKGNRLVYPSEKYQVGLLEITPKTSETEHDLVIRLESTYGGFLVVNDEIY